MLITISGKSGSGKSFISDYLCTINPYIKHINIDTIGHDVLKIETIKKRLVNAFNLTLINNEINRKELGKIVFNSKEAMSTLTNITWPAMEKIIDKIINDNLDKIIILDWALLPKTKYLNIASINILVESNKNKRLKRIIKRDTISIDKFIERDNNSLTYNKKDFDYIIENNDMEETKRKVKEIYNKIIVLKEKRSIK